MGVGDLQTHSGEGLVKAMGQMKRRILVWLSVVGVIATGSTAIGAFAANPPGPPSGLQAYADLSGLHLSWQPGAGAQTSAVYRSGALVSPSTQTATKFVDSPPNGSYTYSVKSWNPNGFSAPASLFVTVNVPPAGTPRGLAAQVDPMGVHLSWQPAANAWVYFVYRNGTQISSNSLQATAFTDSNIQNGQAYTYTVRTWNMNSLSAAASLAVWVNVPPGVPTGLQAFVDPQVVHLSWQPPANAWTYGVYRNGGPQISPNNQTATTFIDPSFQSGQTYTYTVRT